MADGETTKMEKHIVSATMTTELILVVEAPKGTSESDLFRVAKTLDGGLFSENTGLFSGGWEITNVRPVDQDDEELDTTDPHDISGDLQSLKTAEIQRLNDQLRTTRTGGQVVLTSGLLDLDETPEILTQVAAYDEFPAENDPHGEHDFGAFDFKATDEQTHRIMWKIDYYDPEMTGHSEDPTNPQITRRVMTVMLASEY